MLNSKPRCWTDARRLELVETWLAMPGYREVRRQPAGHSKERLALLIDIRKLAQARYRNYYLINLLNEYNMHRPAVTGATTRPASFPSAASATPVVATLLGVRVTAYAVIRSAEHRRRETAGLGAVINPALLDRLIDLPAAMPVSDPVVWAEMAEQPPGILERSGTGTRVTRRLESPLGITDVVVDAVAGKELRAVQDASLFAGFTRRWVATARSRLPHAATLEAKLYGVGILAPGHRVLLPAEKPVAPTVDGWSWLLEEKAYRRWLSRQAGNRETGSRGPATGGASGGRGD